MKTKIVLTNEKNRLLSKIQTLFLYIFWVLAIQDTNIVFILILLTGLTLKRVISSFYYINKKLYIEWIRYRQNKESSKVFEFRKWLSFLGALVISIHLSLSMYYSYTYANVLVFIIMYTIFSILFFIPILMFIFIFLVED